MAVAIDVRGLDSQATWLCCPSYGDAIFVVPRSGDSMLCSVKVAMHGVTSLMELCRECYWIRCMVHIDAAGEVGAP